MSAIATDVDWCLVLVLLPLAGGLASFLWPRIGAVAGITTTGVVVVAVIGLAMQIIRHGTYRHVVGGWGAPLGIDLYVDGLSLVMLCVTALVGLAISVYSSRYFAPEVARRFWPLWLFLLSALNALFVSADIFNLYVTLELLGLAAVALAALTGSADALLGAMRYVLATLLGSLSFLLGIALLYQAYGTVDITTLGERVEESPALWAALGLIGAGLALKTALFPLHFWLPPAHASAPAPVSAALSALVVKGSFYILLRLWLELFASVTVGVEALFGVLGAIAILWGSVQALRQTRIKLLVAYSTVAQIGYLFIAFPLAAGNSAAAWSAAAYLAFAHALSKAAMFLAAGNLLRFGGHDRIADLDRVVQRLPITASAFALAGVSIMGLPPSAGFVGKWLLLETAVAQGRWGLAGVMLIGGVLAAAYVFKVLGSAFTEAQTPHAPLPVPATMEWAALLLALVAILSGFTGSALLFVLNLGNPFASTGAAL